MVFFFLKIKYMNTTNIHDVTQISIACSQVVMRGWPSDQDQMV